MNHNILEYLLENVPKKLEHSYSRRALTCYMADEWKQLAVSESIHGLRIYANEFVIRMAKRGLFIKKMRIINNRGYEEILEFD